MYSISFCFVLLTFLVIVTTIDSSLINDGTSCDGTGWISYRDEKCYKLIKKWASRDQAKDLCAQEGLNSSSTPQLVTIKSADEQAYLTELVFRTSAVTINVWIGNKRKPENQTQFVWDDGSEVEKYTNWAEGSPTDNAQQSCVVMKSQFVRSLNTAGQWRDVPCEMPNYVICEKLQSWSFTKLQQTLLDTRKELRDSDEAKENSVPIGFLYTQFPNENAPSRIWPSLTWTDVSSAYAGVFFRAVGGEAALFGQVQEDNCPQITNFTVFYDGPSSSLSQPAISSNRIPGTFRSSSYYLNGIAFDGSTDEVRPRNMAIRIWKRTR